jgi:cytochrome c heme-lyase
MSNNSTEESTTTSSGGKCPVDHQNPSSLWKVLGIGRNGGNSATTSPDNAMPASLEEAARHAQTPHPEQRLPLSTYRSESSIPRGRSDKPLPHHQLGGNNNNNWIYPSEQQVFNAMKRKGWEGIEEEAIPSFLQVHNSVNERSWRQVRQWEQRDVELVRFEGRPKDLSPKAWLWSTLLFQEEPFDRHDWYIDNGVDHEKRYVLDFYMTEDRAMGGIPRVDIDVRPALDTPQAFVQRGTMVLKELFPGIARELEKFSQPRSTPQGS